MDRIEKWFQERLSAPWRCDPTVRVAHHYVESGDRAVLRQIKPSKSGIAAWWALADVIAPPNTLLEIDRRALHVLATLGAWESIGRWLNKHLAYEKSDEDYVGTLIFNLTNAGFDSLARARTLVPWVDNLAKNRTPTSAGRYLLSLSDNGLRQLAREAADGWYSCHAMLEFMLEFAPKRVQLMLGDLLRPKDTMRLPQTCCILLEKGSGAYDRDVLVAFRQARDTHDKFLAGVELDKHNHSAYGREVLQAARASLAGGDSNNRHDVVCEWMVDAYGREVVPEIADYMRRTSNTTGHAKQFVIPHCISVLGKEALPIVLAGLESGRTDTAFVALTHLVETGDDSHHTVIRERIEAGMRQQDTGRIIRYIALAGRWSPSAVSETLWALAENDSRPVREAAARALGRMGDDAIGRAAKLLKHRKADIRLVAVTTLAGVNTASALRAMEDRLDVEDNDDVREAILAALQEAWQSAGKALTREDVEARAIRNAARVKWPPATWLASLALPSINYTSGEPVPEHMVRHLLWRQSRSQDIRPPHELKPLYGLIDRATSGGFALALLNEYIASGADAKDKWALASAALLGDDRIVPILAAQVKDWVDRGRGKLAEYAVQALALLATDRALLAIDSIAMRYSVKMKNVGAAASEAFVSAAVSLGISPEELGDKVVPWLGFEPGEPREIACGWCGERTTTRDRSSRRSWHWRIRALPIARTTHSTFQMPAESELFTHLSWASRRARIGRLTWRTTRSSRRSRNWNAQ